MIREDVEKEFFSTLASDDEIAIEFGRQQYAVLERTSKECDGEIQELLNSLLEYNSEFWNVQIADLLSEKRELVVTQKTHQEDQEINKLPDASYEEDAVKLTPNVGNDDGYISTRNVVVVQACEKSGSSNQNTRTQHKEKRTYLRPYPDERFSEAIRILSSNPPGWLTCDIIDYFITYVKLEVVKSNEIFIGPAFSNQFMISGNYAALKEVYEGCTHATNIFFPWFRNNHWFLARIVDLGPIKKRTLIMYNSIEVTQANFRKYYSETIGYVKSFFLAEHNISIQMVAQGKMEIQTDDFSCGYRMLITLLEHIGTIQGDQQEGLTITSMVMKLKDVIIRNKNE